MICARFSGCLRRKFDQTMSPSTSGISTKSAAPCVHMIRAHTKNAIMNAQKPVTNQPAITVSTPEMR